MKNISCTHRDFLTCRFICRQIICNQTGTLLKILEEKTMKTDRKIGFIFGTRPEIIKLAPIILEAQRRGIPFFCIHSGQHYSYDMDAVFLSDLGLPKPKYNLNIRSTAPHRQGEHTGRMLISVEDILLNELPYCLLVHGDTNTALAGALSAQKITTTKASTGFEIKVGHVESGLRSYDRSMPEEVNRVLIDHLSDFLFIPTLGAKKIVEKEGVPPDRLFVTGNTIVEAVQGHRKIAEQKSKLLSELSLKSKSYAFLTLHRQENVDSKEAFELIVKGLQQFIDDTKMPMIFPMHPRTLKQAKKFGIKLPEGITTIKPIGYTDCLALESQAKIIFTDSGGVQEEACILKVPCVTLRTTTERPETVEVGGNIVAGLEDVGIKKAYEKMLQSDRDWSNPFGDANTSELILDILEKS